VNVYLPDRWIMLKIVNRADPEQPPLYKVYATWKGSYADADYWKINSGCASVEETEDHYKFFGHSGSVYQCAKDRYGYAYSGAGDMIIDYIERIEELNYEVSIMLEDTDFSGLFQPL